MSLLKSSTDSLQMKERHLKVMDTLVPERAPNLDDLCCFNTLQNQYIDQAIKLITNAFCCAEPMTRYLKIAHHEFIPFAAYVVEKAIRDGLSVGATVGNKLIACAIVEDFADPLNLTHDVDPRFKFIFGLLNHLSAKFFSDKIFEKNHLAHLFITAVDPNYHGEGLSRKVNLEAIKVAAAKNYDFMCCEFTHHYNEQGTVKNINTNKLMIGSQPYKNFVMDGERPFENLDGAATAYIWELKEDALLNYRCNDEAHCHGLKERFVYSPSQHARPNH